MAKFLLYIRHRLWVQLILIALVSGMLFTAFALNNQWMNDYYSTAVASAVTDWRAFFYVSFDAGQFITIDKPPLGIWLSTPFALLFGVSPFTIALPHILAGVGTTLLLFVLIRKVFSVKVALLAILFFVCTPIVPVLFSYNQPDTFLTLFMTASLYSFILLLTERRTRWAVVTGVLLGLGFMTKSLQILPLVVLFSTAFLWKERVSLKQSHVVRSILSGGAAFLVVCLWWPLVVSLTPETDRPYIGSTQDNSPWSLLLGYNGFERITNPTQVAPQIQTDVAYFGGEPGVLRLFNPEFGPNGAWFLPLLLPAIIGCFVTSIAAKRRILVSVSVGWVLLYAGLYSFMQGILHPYYLIVLTPALALTAAAGVMWSINWYIARRSRLRYVLPAVTALSAFIAALLLAFDQTPLTPIAPCIAVVGVLFAVLLVVGRNRTIPIHFIWPTVIVLLLAGPASYVLAGISHREEGPFPSTVTSTVRNASITPDVHQFFATHTMGTRWAAITETTNLAGALQLTTQQPFMALGGYSGNDPVLTLKETKHRISADEVRYFITSVEPSARTTNEPIVQWLSSHPIVFENDTIKIYRLS